MKCEKQTNVEPRKFGFSMEVSRNSTSQIIAFGDTISKLVDSVIAYKKTNFTIEFVKAFIKLLSYDDLKKLEASLISSKEIRVEYLLLCFARKIKEESNFEDYDFSEIEKYVLDSKDIRAIVGLASCASVEYFTLAENLVCNSNSGNLIFDFAKSNYDSTKFSNVINLNKLHQAILETKDKYWIVEFEVRIMNRKPTFFENFWHDGFKDYPKF